MKHNKLDKITLKNLIPTQVYIEFTAKDCFEVLYKRNKQKPTKKNQETQNFRSGNFSNTLVIHKHFQKPQI